MPLSFGLMMAGFGGHSVFPTIYRDMEKPSEYNRVVNWTYVATSFFYGSVAVLGYLMFGADTLKEVQKPFFVKHVYIAREESTYKKERIVDFRKLDPDPWKPSVAQSFDADVACTKPSDKVWSSLEPGESDLADCSSRSPKSRGLECRITLAGRVSEGRGHGHAKHHRCASCLSASKL